MNTTAPVPDRRIAGKAVAALAVVAAVTTIVWSMIVLSHRPRTHDAYIYAYSASLAPEVSGRVVWIGVHNGQRVHKGQVLLDIDPAPYVLKLRQASAQVDALKAEIALTGRRVDAQGSGAVAAAHEAQRARQQLTLAHDTRLRLEPMLAKGFVTAQQVDQARTDEQAARAQLAAATAKATQARQSIGDVASLEADLLGAEAGEALAARNLRETHIVAPVDGRVAGFDLAPGSFATAGHPLLTVIDDANWYAVANFRETDLRHIRPGEHATVWMMGRDGHPLSGTVQSIGQGVQPEGSVGPGLPRVGRDLDWVVVAQRFPVWIHLDRGSTPFLRIGATASVRVQDAQLR
ncbi:HlyD family efflux transporter periplasmic adaptor subunit [Dyella sp. A6]|uniref:HlyD family efflux transporter periplasmic adaptor subunit n=1 Tax=Dyella aluminiiresistens TaxID=3069105 RepID=UPI002E77F61D|nr:HlyD family efflux transporter periplasmic adaptor subunit [Dyella sp. A6]